MNYALTYERLVDRARTRKADERVEVHHVFPKCLGGSDSASNLVALTLREHFVAHQLLAKLFPSAPGLIYSAFRMSLRKRIGSRRYEWLRTRHAERQSALFSGVPLAPETKAKIAASLVGNSRTLGHKLSDDHKAKIVKHLYGNTHTLGLKFSDGTKAKMSEAHAGEKHHYFGKERDDATKAKISAKLKSLPAQTCYHCGLSGKGPGMQMYHFDKCKQNPNQ